MSCVEATPARSRNAAATRAAILKAACGRFSREGYDGASLRDLASDAGVDPALICRYFGSKEDLFAEALKNCASPPDLFGGDPKSFPERVAQMLVVEPKPEGKLEHLLMVLRSAASTKAAEIIRRNNRETFYGPLEEWLGAPDAAVRARAVAGIIMGFAVARAIDDDAMLQDGERQQLCRKVADLLRTAIG
ncbi:TetR/AcrR family transcriptional regulator [Phenylobacterium deserti]|uniref:TetR/AcrR family transcriptional regulator n=1 Tax=Phenylobacterium deserti TaxID=1914756 RepID=A0A328AC09_9CAUL|nr:TetR/AcrR family transcriptional regulator [Phenylobacterium deserti]RAK52272.1 TetR/AcrR family transcriptional regulator [Phenylobacterium deserti]